MREHTLDHTSSPILNTWEQHEALRIHVSGMVQGIGFRPAVYRLAKRLHLTGYVSNHPRGVEIYVEGSSIAIAAFVQELQVSPPAGSMIQHIETESIPAQHSQSFEIRSSIQSGTPSLLLTPDLAPCRSCVTELFDSNNRRYRYPFISCTQCGPRYSIMQTLPYDRATTTMEGFELCGTCREEYSNPADNRFHAQTNACADCGPQLNLWNNEHYQNLPTEQILTAIQRCLKGGEIVAVKSTGGFLLLSDASNQSAIERLRLRKHRPAKPLAVLFSSVSQLQDYAEVADDEIRWLEHASAPIVILTAKKESPLAWSAIHGNLHSIGAMLPASPLLHLISHDFGKPLVATSANISGCPLLYDDAEAAVALTGIADLIVGHNRAIRHPQDDSVLRITEKARQLIWMRRGRGLAPFVPTQAPAGHETMIAFGALMKSSVAYQLSSGYQYLTQFLGNTDVYEAQKTYRTVQQYWEQLLHIKPTHLLADAHPGYFSHQAAARLSDQLQIPLHIVPHHAAHAMAILAEHQLLHEREPMAVFTWDGTGLGDDGTLWGSVCFTYNNSKLTAYQHGQVFPVLGGDRMSYDNRLPLLSLWYRNQLPLNTLQSLFTEKEFQLYRTLVSKPNSLMTSSMGRLFDAVSCLLGFSQQSQFEGQAAMTLEDQAHAARRRYIDQNTYTIPTRGANWNYGLLLDEIRYELETAVDPALIALRFHRTLAQTMLRVADELNIHRIAFSGGVFQNSLLVDLLYEHQPSHMKLYFHKHLPPNDENIALGQLWYHQTKQSFTPSQTN